MLTLPNILSLARIPLALAFLQEHTQIRFIAIVLAMLSDSLDGMVARRTKQATQLGAMLDPLADKFFMLFALTIFLMEGRLGTAQMMALLSRDVAVAVFALYLGITGGWATYKLRAIWCGKVSTTLQFFVVIALLFGYRVPDGVYTLFIVLGAAALAELYIIRQKSHTTA